MGTERAEFKKAPFSNKRLEKTVNTFLAAALEAPEESKVTDFLLAANTVAQVISRGESREIKSVIGMSDAQLYRVRLKAGFFRARQERGILEGNTTLPLPKKVRSGLQALSSLTYKINQELAFRGLPKSQFTE